MKERFHIHGFHYTCQFHGHNESLPSVLMLHGFMGDRRVFSHLLENLKKSCNPITVDLLGHGKSDKPTDPASYNEEQLVKHILSLIHKIDRSPLFLYGYSMGGRLALKTVQQAPDLIKGLILESTNPGILSEEKRAERRKTDRQRGSSIKENFYVFLKEWEALPLFASPNDVGSELAKFCNQIHTEQDPEAMAAAISGFSPGSMKTVTKENQNYYNPVLLIAGSEDQKYVAINKEMEQLFPKATLKILKAGHRVHLDNPNTIGKEINSFIEQNS